MHSNKLENGLESKDVSLVILWPGVKEADNNSDNNNMRKIKYTTALSKTVCRQNADGIQADCEQGWSELDGGR
ncbi:hypothetical protein MJO28_008262 [Puccinia striiformis f. sp. tritici]|uniref:Uncharacterized protein n=1 Tax=Puccinia striiformis f. sp. tritici TaxID=168172 RepID=A0ACC0E9X9_9BASI|nr:hypothetical protein MJO28_008262 [Puccinia striiformis f. sp. tritici]